MMKRPWSCKVLRVQYVKLKLLVIRRLCDFRYIPLLLMLLRVQIVVVVVVVVVLRLR